MPHKILATIALVGMLIALVNCGSRPSQMPEPTVSSAQVVLRISGSGTTTPILSAVKPAFEADIPDYCLELLPGSGTGGGVKGLTKGILDVAAMARPAKDEEAAQGVEYVEFGQSGVAVLVHPSVDVANLTRAQIVAIFSGEITNWSQVGGLDLNLMMYVRDEGESSTKELRRIILGDTPFPETAEVLTSQADMQAAVARVPGSVGFGSWPSAVASGANMHAIALDGVAPGERAYPIVTPIGIGYLVLGTKLSTVGHHLPIRLQLTPQVGKSAPNEASEYRNVGTRFSFVLETI